MSLLNRDFAKNFLTHEAWWCQGHGALVDSPMLGFGLVYYALVHAFRFKLCVCLGSGGGFVPRMMRQAQIDSEIPDSKTILVDMDDPQEKWGRPNWTSPNSFFRANWPDIYWWKQTTLSAASRFVPGMIDFLHIDADHSLAYADFDLYDDLVRVGGIITIHDTITGGGCTAGVAVGHIRKRTDWDIIDFPDIGGAGVAIARRIT